jgi:hypothetical protein
VIVRTSLPSWYLPPSGFLTLSTVCSHRHLVTLFQATSVHRLNRPSELFPLVQAGCLSASRSSPAVTRGRPRTSTANRRSALLLSGPTSEYYSARAFATPDECCSHSRGPVLSWPFHPLRGLPSRPLGRSPPLLRFATQRRTVARGHSRVSIRSSLGSSTREDPASMGLSTLRNRPTRGREPDNQQLLCRRGV